MSPNRVLFSYKSLLFLSSKKLPEFEVDLTKINLAIGIEEIDDHAVLSQVVDKVLVKNGWDIMS